MIIRKNFCCCYETSVFTHFYSKVRLNIEIANDTPKISVAFMRRSISFADG